jgi:predicted Zn-dependent protease
LSESARLSALREMVAADPGDGLARLLLGRELLGAGDPAGAAEHLTHYVSHVEGDKGAAYGVLAEALTALGRRDEALAALTAGIENARAHRHLGLVGTLEEQREALAD